MNKLSQPHLSRISLLSALLLATAACVTRDPGVAAQMVLTDAECRNTAQVEAFGETWLIAEPAPNEFRNAFPLAGSIRRDDSTATFTAGDRRLELILEGSEVGVAANDVCTGWTESEQVGDIEHAELRLINPGCREGAVVEALGEVWQLAEPAPEEWRQSFPISGTVGSRIGSEALFEGNGAALRLVRVGSPNVTADCKPWLPNPIGETGEEG